MKISGCLLIEKGLASTLKLELTSLLLSTQGSIGSGANSSGDHKEEEEQLINGINRPSTN